MDQLEQYERLGRTVTAGVEKPQHLSSRRLAIWHRLIGMAAEEQIKKAKETENAGV